MIGYEALQAQQEANMFQERLISCIQELAESNRQLADAVNNQRTNSEESSGSYYGVFRTINDLFQVGRGLFDLRRFFANRDAGRLSGTRDPKDTGFSTPPSGSARRALSAERVRK